jgi:Tol biopolymer transport system component
MAFQQNSLETGDDIWVLEMDGSHTPQRFLHGTWNERQPRFSPDSHWIAYSPNESGHDDVYVQPFPGPGGKHLVSTDGGIEPRWSPDGHTLFCLNDDKIMAADITVGSGFSASTPRVVFQGAFVSDPTMTATYAVSLDGRRVLIMQPVEREPPINQIHVVMNWFEELRRTTASH